MDAPAPNPLSRALLQAVLDDRTSDRFVCELIWPRLGYGRDADGIWRAGPTTTPAWREAFASEPAFIAQRPASVALTRSIAPEHPPRHRRELVARPPGGAR